ncbi:MAG: hypothetical protein SV375_19465 [Thermodesulfobacteriota bacterium]|nr:hypothetical protein [Thermodesulfobacteriota bacterium]
MKQLKKDFQADCRLVKEQSNPIRGLGRYFHSVKRTPQSTNFHRRIDNERAALSKTGRCKSGNVKNVLRGVVLLKFFQRS